MPTTIWHPAHSFNSVDVAYEPHQEAAAAERWVAAVNADGTFGTWRYALARKIAQVRQILDNGRAG